ncbi:MAG: tyrosine-type recombinase/integrase [Acidimicrobiia bacterium]
MGRPGLRDPQWPTGRSCQYAAPCQTYCRCAGIDGSVTPYDLRHTATSVLSATDVAPELLADLLGHVDNRMVFRHYRHPVTPTINVAAKHIERAIKA